MKILERPRTEGTEGEVNTETTESTKRVFTLENPRENGHSDRSSIAHPPSVSPASSASGVATSVSPSPPPRAGAAPPGAQLPPSSSVTPSRSFLSMLLSHSTPPPSTLPHTSSHTSPPTLSYASAAAAGSPALLASAGRCSSSPALTSLTSPGALTAPVTPTKPPVRSASSSRPSLSPSPAMSAVSSTSSFLTKTTAALPPLPVASFPASRSSAPSASSSSRSSTYVSSSRATSTITRSSLSAPSSPAVPATRPSSRSLSSLSLASSSNSSSLSSSSFVTTRSPGSAAAPSPPCSPRSLSVSSLPSSLPSEEDRAQDDNKSKIVLRNEDFDDRRKDGRPLSVASLSVASLLSSLPSEDDAQDKTTRNSEEEFRLLQGGKDSELPRAHKQMSEYWNMKEQEKLERQSRNPEKLKKQKPKGRVKKTINMGDQRTDLGEMFKELGEFSTEETAPLEPGTSATPPTSSSSSSNSSSPVSSQSPEIQPVIEGAAPSALPRAELRDLRDWHFKRGKPANLMSSTLALNAEFHKLHSKKGKNVPKLGRDVESLSDPLLLASAYSRIPPEGPVKWMQAAIHEEILKRCASIHTLMSSRREIHLASIEAVRSTVLEIWPSATLEMFGSFSVGLATPVSDIDLVVCANWDTSIIPGVFDYSAENARHYVRHLAQELQTKPWASEVTAIEATHVPVVSVMVCVNPQLSYRCKLDVSFNTPIHHGLTASLFYRNLILQFPVIKPLVFVMKQLLIHHGLDRPYQGGLSSCGLVLMVASVLMHDQLLQQRRVMQALQDSQLELYRSLNQPLLPFSSFAIPGFNNPPPFDTNNSPPTDPFSHTQSFPNAANSNLHTNQPPFSTPNTLPPATLPPSSLSNTTAPTPPNSASVPTPPFPNATDNFPPHFPNASNTPLPSSSSFPNTAPAPAYPNNPSASLPFSNGAPSLPPTALPPVLTQPTLTVPTLSNPVAALSDESHLGRLFLLLLDIYGNHFNSMTEGIAVREGHFRKMTCLEFVMLNRKDCFPWFDMDPLLLIDPLDPRNNVGKSCYRISGLQRCYAQALSALEQTTNSAQPSDTGPTVARILSNFLGPDPLLSLPAGYFAPLAQAKDERGFSSSLANGTPSVGPETAPIPLSLGFPLFPVFGANHMMGFGNPNPNPQDLPFYPTANGAEARLLAMLSPPLVPGNPPVDLASLGSSLNPQLSFASLPNNLNLLGAPNGFNPLMHPTLAGFGNGSINPVFAPSPLNPVGVAGPLTLNPVFANGPVNPADLRMPLPEKLPTAKGEPQSVPADLSAANAKSLLSSIDLFDGAPKIPPALPTPSSTDSSTTSEISFKTVPELSRTPSISVAAASFPELTRPVSIPAKAASEPPKSEHLNGPKAVLLGKLGEGSLHNGPNGPLPNGPTKADTAKAIVLSKLAGVAGDSPVMHFLKPRGRTPPAGSVARSASAPRARRASVDLSRPLAFPPLAQVQVLKSTTPQVPVENGISRHAAAHISSAVQSSQEASPVHVIVCSEGASQSSLAASQDKLTVRRSSLQDASVCAPSGQSNLDSTQRVSASSEAAKWEMEDSKHSTSTVDIDIIDATSVSLAPSVPANMKSKKQKNRALKKAAANNVHKRT